MKDKKATVVIPFYKDNLSAYELVALEQCFRVLSGHPVIAIKPERLALPSAVTAYTFSKIVSFDNTYFENVQGYNRLMLSAEFYKGFIDYEFILIYQLDAFVFSDDLLEWCDKGIDYVGAPWINPGVFPDIVKKIKSKLQYYFHTRYNVQQNGLPSPRQFEYKVGNGGFSLRRTKIFHELCIKLQDKIAEYNNNDSHLFNEDVFWSIEVNRKRKILNIPQYKMALKFSFEFYPQQAYITNNHQLPFGCHAWDLTLDFWKPVFKEYGYVIG